MRDYGIVSPKFWIGETGKLLRGDPVSQVVAAYLMTSPHSNMTGVFHLPILYICHETGTPSKGASKALRRLIQVGFCEYETESETIFVVRMAAYQIAETLSAGDKRVLGLRKELDRMPSALMRQRFLTVYGRAFHLVPDDWKPSPLEGPPKPLRSQDQDQEQDQDHDQDQEQGGAGGRKTARASRSRDATRIPDDFGMTGPRMDIAVAEGVDPVRTMAKFVDYWRAAAGPKARKRDWDATWRNWCRTEADRAGKNGSERKSRFAQAQEALDRA